MAQRLLCSRTLKQAWTFLNTSTTPDVPKILMSAGKPFRDFKPQTAYSLFKTDPPVQSLSLSNYPERNRVFIDLFTNNPHKKLYMPTISINQLKVYEDITSQKTIADPVVNNIKIIDAPVPGRPEKKEAVRMILIRRRKMRKHKLRKLRKRMKFVFAKIKMKKELRKEQAFRAELLGQVEEAEKFDAKAYVENIIKTIQNQPKIETDAEIKERFRQLKKLNKYKTHFVPPRFDD